jgi:hypothetical protein
MRGHLASTTSFAATHESGIGTGRASSAPQQPRQLYGSTADPQVNTVEGLYLTPKRKSRPPHVGDRRTP